MEHMEQKLENLEREADAVRQAILEERDKKRVLAGMLALLKVEPDYPAEIVEI